MTTFGPYPARVVDVHDGDTIHLDLDLGFSVVLMALGFNEKPQLSCRVYGINAPELTTEAGKQARDFASSLLRPGMHVMVKSHGYDKYGGRYLGEITLPDSSDFASLMLAAGHAVPYFGGLKS